MNVNFSEVYVETPYARKIPHGRPRGVPVGTLRNAVAYISISHDFIFSRRHITNLHFSGVSEKLWRRGQGRLAMGIRQLRLVPRNGRGH